MADQMLECQSCSGLYEELSSSAADPESYCDIDCEHETCCASDEDCEYPDVHLADAYDGEDD